MIDNGLSRTSGCDVCCCNIPSKQGLILTADTVRQLVEAGYEPGTVALRAVRKQIGETIKRLSDVISRCDSTKDPVAQLRLFHDIRPAEENVREEFNAALRDWKLFVVRRLTAWTLCPSCASRASCYIPEIAARWQTALAVTLDVQVSHTSAMPIRRLEGHTAAVNAVYFLANQQLLSASSDATLRLWDISSGECLRVLSGHSSSVDHVCVSLDENMAVSQGRDTVRFWDLRTGQCLHAMELPQQPESIAFLDREGHLLVGSEDKLQVWRLPREAGRKLPLGDAIRAKVAALLRKDKRPLKEVTVGGTIYSIAASHDRLLVGGWSRGIDGKETDFSTAIARKSMNSVGSLFGHSGCVRAVAFAPTGRLAASGGGFGDCSVRIWDTSTWELRQTLVGHAGPVNSIVFSDDDKYLLTAGLRNSSPPGTTKWEITWSGETKLWDLETGLCLHSFAVDDQGTNAVAWRRDDGLIATGSEDGVIRIWQAKIETLRPVRGPVVLAELATPAAEQTRMQSCDVCGQSTTWAVGTSYTADDFRELVARGFEPVERMAFYLAQAKALNGLDEQKALFAWKNGLVAQSTTHWLLCPGCASLAARHLPRPAGGKPPERIKEPLTEKMFVSPPSAQMVVTDYHSRGQSDGPSASHRPPADLPARTDPETSTPRADVASQAKTSDTFSFPCPGCGKRLKASRTLIGRRAKCRTCGSAVDIPDPSHAANIANDATQPPIGQAMTAEATTAEGLTSHSTTTPATTDPAPADAPRSTTSPAEGSEVPCCSCGVAIPESARRTDVVGDMLGSFFGSLTGGELGNTNRSRKTMPDLFGGAMRCARCGRWMCCSCAERKAKAQGASHAALIASQARGTITHEGCGGIFERP